MSEGTSQLGLPGRARASSEGPRKWAPGAGPAARAPFVPTRAGVVGVGAGALGADRVCVLVRA